MLPDAVDLIAKGAIVAMPTETVYGLAADAANDRAVARIFEAKGRPQFNPLIIHVTGKTMAARYVDFSPLAERLAEAFWPGPLTLVLPRKPSVDKDSAVSLLVSAGLDTIAVRAPDHDVAQALIGALGRPVAAPSANRSGTISPTTPSHVFQSLGDRIDGVIDGGACAIGLESAIVKIDGDQASLLRPGGVRRDDIEAVIGKTLVEAKKSAAPQAPGMLASHYAPSVAVRLDADRAEGNEAFLGFGKMMDAEAKAALNLSVSGDMREAAANLFAHLRALDAACQDQGLDRIAAAPIPNSGLGEAINDRLARAAAPRD
ncbi:MAG: L-threonylcarbamoyladenylate synthase [Pseudomonadota bacterium]